MQLLAHGAPPDLVAGATRAQGDELAHARACFGIASAIAGEKLGPGQLDIEGVWEMGSDARDLLVSTIVEGCINETLAASEAAWLSESCRVASVSEALAQIAEDEGRHAALAWRTIRWILSEHPELAQVAASTFATGLPTEGPEPVGPRDDVWLAGYGCMPAHESRRLARDVWREVITPCATALLRAEACGDVAIQP